MKYYSHRGNIRGPDSASENSPKYVESAIKLGFDVEVDLRIIGNDLYFGHDYPTFKVDEKWIDERADHLLLHVKDFKALKRIVDDCHIWHFFCHHNDPFTITSKGYIWLHDINSIADKSCIVPLIGEDHVESYPTTHLDGVCSDYILRCRDKF